jgi:hypothetical protein
MRNELVNILVYFLLSKVGWKQDFDVLIYAKESLFSLTTQYVVGICYMGKRRFHSSTRLDKKNKFRLVRNPWWMKQPYKLEPCAN